MQIELGDRNEAATAAAQPFYSLLPCTRGKWGVGGDKSSLIAPPLDLIAVIAPPFRQYGQFFFRFFEPLPHLMIRMLQCSRVAFLFPMRPYRVIDG